MGITHIIWSLIVGFVVGLIARAIMPGADHMGFLATSLLGIVGSFVGGFLGSLISKPTEGQMFHPAGFIMSVIGAAVLLFAWRHLG
ncbi:MAG TPA: GlsB/YeaQ/YmgE family stress response membrane protein [Candidatus Acidoferrales bacterium]|nr:GlsB/YeaQ/YmgE family stress response membrane protein [Candidatus Acidoferrales bacterium]